MKPFLYLKYGVSAKDPVYVTAQASEQQDSSPAPKQGWYIGLDAVKSEVDVEGTKEKPDASAGLNIGYDFQLMPQFFAGLELEVINYGSKKLRNQQMRGSRGEPVNASVDQSITAININLRPKYYVTDGLYVGGLIGIGSAEYKQEASAPGYESLELYEDESSAGVRQPSADFTKGEHEVTSLYVGLGYKF